jgi:hypothetical protein
MRWSPVLPVVLLAAVAGTQVWLARSVDLAAWKGGGFGMFSTLDDGPHRRVRVYVSGPGRSEEVEISASLEDTAMRLATLPSQTWLSRLADGVVADERRHDRPVSHVRVEVWRVRFDSVTLGATSILLRRYEHDAPP